MDPRRAHTRRLSVPAQRSRVTLRRRRQPISRAALKSLAPLNLDIPSSSVGISSNTEPAPTSLYLAVLSHLAELESRLPSASSSARQLLHQLRDEVVAFFPSTPEPQDEYDFEYDLGLSAALDFRFDLDMRRRYAELSTLSLEDAKNKLVELSTRYDDAKTRFGALVEDAKTRLEGVRRWADGALPSMHIPDLSNVHMPAVHIPEIPRLDLDASHIYARLAELRAALPADLSSATDKLLSYIEDDADGDISWLDTRWKGLNLHKSKLNLEKEEKEVDWHAVALAKAEYGAKLIEYEDLPEMWRNNEFVLTGYRFIPSAKWGALVRSMVQMHNETANIQTHLVPLLTILWFILPRSYFSWAHPFFSDPSPSFSGTVLDYLGLNITHLKNFQPLPPSSADAPPKSLFLLAAGACLACSTVWHTLAGCSDSWLLEAGARVDYVGIGWLISASVSSVMYYGFACQPAMMRSYIGVAILVGIAGSILPFQGWFNERRNKKWRIAFFLLCTCSALFPLGHLAYRHSFRHMWEFISPIVPSLVSYLVGLVFYATHFPECCCPGWFDWAGSHAIWHVFIVIAIREHWKGMDVLHATSRAFSCGAA